MLRALPCRRVQCDEVWSKPFAGITGFARFLPSRCQSASTASKYRCISALSEASRPNPDRQTAKY